MVDGKHMRFNKRAVSERSFDELVGLAHGLLADGMIIQSEAEYLQKWLANRPTLQDQPLLAGLFERVSEYLSDDYLDEDEALDLKNVLSQIVGGNFELGELTKSTTLPLCQPAPVIEIPSKRFCFTGTFNYGNRKTCEASVKSLGGFAGSLTQKTNYLVIGHYATSSWKHSSFGNKILKAVEYRENGCPIHIVAEESWLKYI